MYEFIIWTVILTTLFIYNIYQFSKFSDNELIMIGKIFGCEKEMAENIKKRNSLKTEVIELKNLSSKSSKEFNLLIDKLRELIESKKQIIKK